MFESQVAHFCLYTFVYIIHEGFLVPLLICEAIAGLLLACDEGRSPSVGARTDWDYVWLLVLQGSTCDSGSQITSLA